MNDGPGLSLAELRRRLSDLAESVETEQPWDDPLPHVLRAADVETQPRPTPGPFAVARGRVARIGWPRFNPVPLVSVAAAFLVIALIGILVHGGGDGSKKSAESAPDGGSAAAAGGAQGQTSAGSSAAGTSAAGSTTGSGSQIVPRASACVSLPVSAKVVLSAPSEILRGAALSVRVSTSGGLRLASATVVVVRSGSDEVVGRLVPNVGTPSPSTSGSVASFVVSGRLVRTSTSCADRPGNLAPGPIGSPATSLPDGRYRLVVTGSTGGGRVAGAPVVITIHR